MNFFKKLLNKGHAPTSNEAFWQWFDERAETFYRLLKEKDSAFIQTQFLQKVMPELQALNEAFYCETGMFDETTAELVITAEGDVKSFVFVEELIAAAPQLDHWKFTALKSPTGSGSVKMHDLHFDSSNIFFFCIEQPEYPDEIDLTLVYTEFSEERKDMITQGVLIYLDSLMGELDAATLIDNVTVQGPDGANEALIPMEKLNDFLLWKEKEFLEKYQGVRYNTKNDEYSALEATDEDGLPLIAVIDAELLEWDAKASHPWMMIIEIDYEKTRGISNNGMPNAKHQQLMTRFDEELTGRLVDSAGYLNLGRQTAKGKRNIYWACKEFRTSSKTAHELILAYRKDLAISYTIYKDKYWKTMDAFRTNG